MKKYRIPLSKLDLYSKIAGVGALVIVGCTLVTIVFHNKITFSLGLQTIMLIAMWIIGVGLWLVGSHIMLKTWSKTNYYLTSDALIISKKGWFNDSHDELYRYDTISSVSARTNILGEFGTVTVRFLRNENVVMHAVENPLKQAEKIKQLVAQTKLDPINPLPSQ